MRTIRLKITDLFDFEGVTPPPVPPTLQEIQGLVERQFAFLGSKPEVAVEATDVVLRVPVSSKAGSTEAARLAAKAAQRASQGDYPKAISIYKRVLELDPTLASARRDLAMVYMEVRDFDNTISNMIDALRLNPDDPWSWVVLGNLYLREKKDLESGERFIRRGLEIAPNDPWALNSLAVVAKERGDADEALSLFDKAIAANPEFPNAYVGKANVLATAGHEVAATETLSKLFTHARLQDYRSEVVFSNARDLYANLQQSEAKRSESDAFKTVHSMRQELAQVSEFRIRLEETDFSDSAGARIQMAWRHGRDHHVLLTRRGFPAHLRYHLEAHELSHLRLEVAARSAGKNRFFGTTPKTRDIADRYVGADFTKLAKQGYPKDAVARVSEAMLTGLCSFLFNCPLDMVIEADLRNRFPVLRAAQFVSTSILANEAKETVTNERVQRITPRKIATASNSLNGAYAVFLDHLFENATDFSRWYRKLPTFDMSVRLFAHWQQRVGSLGAGDEYSLVDEFADMIGLRGWYEWMPDPGHHNITEGAPLEGTTNPDLLREKHPAAVWHLLGALKRYDAMTRDEVRRIAFEIGIVGQRGLDYSDPAPKYSLRSIPGENFSGLQLMCLMFAGFKRIAPEQDVGIDLEEPFATALQLFEGEKGDQ